MHYILIRKKQNKKMYIRIKEGQVVVSAPYYTPKRNIDAFVEQNKKWIDNQLKISESNSLKNGDIIHLCDGDYVLKVDPSLLRISLKKGEIKVRNQKDFEKILKTYACKIITPIFEDIQNQLGFKNMVLRYGIYSSQWGSCHKSKREIHLNAYLLMTDFDFIQSVILHEFAHMYVQNHSKQFYDVLYKWMPDYEEIHRMYKHFRFKKISDKDEL